MVIDVLIIIGSKKNIILTFPLVKFSIFRVRISVKSTAWFQSTKLKYQHIKLHMQFM